MLLFVDGKQVEAAGQVALGSLANKDPFNIGYYENMANSAAHCEISQARVWKLPQGLPEDIAAVVAAHYRQPGTVSSSGQGRPFLALVFRPGNEDIDDMGNNGNRLCYTPWHYKKAPRSGPFPRNCTGKYYYVNNRSPNATEPVRGPAASPI